MRSGNHRTTDSGPIRTCVGCRRRADQDELVRFTAEHGRIAPDFRRRRPGRGAYLHRDAACVERAIRRGGLARALRARLDAVSSAELRQSVLASIASPTSTISTTSTTLTEMHYSSEPPNVSNARCEPRELGVADVDAGAAAARAQGRGQG